MQRLCRCIRFEFLKPVNLTHVSIQLIIDELGCEPCVITTELKAGGLPFCKVRIYKGTTRIRNETSCVSDDVFNIKTGRKIPCKDRLDATSSKYENLNLINW